MRGGAGTVVTTMVDPLVRTSVGIGVKHVNRPKVLKPLINRAYSTGAQPVTLKRPVEGSGTKDVHTLTVDGARLAALPAATRPHAAPHVRAARPHHRPPRPHRRRGRLRLRGHRVQAPSGGRRAHGGDARGGGEQRRLERAEDAESHPLRD